MQERQGLKKMYQIETMHKMLNLQRVLELLGEKMLPRSELTEIVKTARDAKSTTNEKMQRNQCMQKMPEVKIMQRRPRVQRR